MHIFVSFYVLILASFADSTPVEGKPAVRLRIRRHAGHVTAVIYDSEGNERVIEDDPTWNRSHQWVDYEIPVIRYDGQQWTHHQHQLVSVNEERSSDGDEETITFSRPEVEALSMKLPRNFFFADDTYTDADLNLPSTKYDNSKIFNDFVRISDTVKRGLSPTPNKRAGPAKAVVEDLVIVDYALYKEALSEADQDKELTIRTLKSYYKMIIALVDLRYSQMKAHELKIRVTMAGLFIAEDRTASPWSEFQIRFHRDGMVVDPNDALNALHEWLKEQMDDLPAHDHAMAFTKYPLVAHNGHIASGMAYIETTCQKNGYACSLVEEVGGLASVGTAVHELGHSLGAKHDGEGENMACPISDNYVMSPGNAAASDVRANFFRFSKCTIKEFQRFIQSGKGECLFDSQAARIHEGITLIGQEYTPDRQCKDMYGEESGLCPIKVDPPEEICSRIWCIKPGDPPSCTTKTSVTAVYGTPCGVRKVCVLGQCQSKSRLILAPSMHGDSNADNENSLQKEKPLCDRDENAAYCAVMVRNSPEACVTRPDLNLYCCRTCGHLSRLKSQRLNEEEGT